MQRPTTTEVDLALLISQLDSPTASNAQKLLALEVRALREELGKEKAQHTEARLDLLAARRSVGDCRDAYDKLRERLATVLQDADARGVRIDLLVAEVRALREELAEASHLRSERDGSRKHVATQRVDIEQLRATIARVEALLTTTAFGRVKPEPVGEHAMISAKSLRAALRGES